MGGSYLNNQIRIDNSVIESLLSLLSNSQKGGTNMEFSKEENALLDAPFLQDSQSRKTALQLKKFADGMPGGFFIYRANDTEEIIYANQAMLRIFNCDTMEEFRELTGNSFQGIVHPDDLEAVQRSIREQIAKSQYDLDYVEYRIIQKGGRIRWIDDYGHFVHSEVVGDIFYVFIGDTTEKKWQQIKEKEKLLNENHKKEQQLQNRIEEYNHELKIIHQEYLRRLEMIEGLSIDYESIFYVDLDNNSIKAYRINSRFEKKFPEQCKVCQFTGFDSDYIKEWVHPDDKNILYGVTDPEYIRQKITENGKFHLNYRIIKEKKIEYMQMRIVNVGSEEHISQVVLGYRNVDDEIIQEMKQKQILTDALNKANLANDAKNLFLSNMSHDIRTPMNAIVGFISLIKKHMDDKEKISGYLNMITTASDQLLQLLNDVLEISRIEAGDIHMEEEECSLIEIVKQVETTVFSQATAKNIMLSLDVSNLRHDGVYTDQQKISQILSYLVDNAVKYTKMNGRVTIMVIEQEKLQDDYTTYQFVIEDNGIGISEEFLTHIYEPFEREKNTTLSGIHGTGLGLTIAKDLVKMLGGNISVSSVVGEGSQFTVTIPLLVQNQVAVQPGDSYEIPMRFSKSKRILIVDDFDINLEIEKEVLKDAGFLVDTALDGSIAVDKMKNAKPGEYDLILMDIQMPIMNGYLATRAIRKIEDPILSNIPIIAVSANTFDEDKKMAIESGMNAHLPKPLDTTHLYKLLWKFLKDI